MKLTFLWTCKFFPFVWKTWMILTRKRLLLDIFFTCRLSKLLTFCEFATVNFKPCNRGVTVTLLWNYAFVMLYFPRRRGTVLICPIGRDFWWSCNATWNRPKHQKCFFFQWQTLARSCPLPAALGEPDSGKNTTCKVALAATGGWKKNFFASVSEKVTQNYPSLESLFKYITLPYVPCLYSSIDITTTALLKVLFFIYYAWPPCQKFNSNLNGKVIDQLID